MTRALPSAWYRTSNTHFFSILDFEAFCRDVGMRLVRKAYFNPGGPIRCCLNLRAEYAVTLLEVVSGGMLERYRLSSEH